jgi:hypothetical protein
VATDWKARGIAPIVQQFKNNEPAISGYLAGDVASRIAVKASREREQRLAERTSQRPEQRGRKPAPPPEPRLDSEPGSPEVQHQAAPEEKRSPAPAGPMPSQQKEQKPQEPKPPKPRASGSIAGTIWTSDTNSEEFVFESDGRFIRRWNFGEPVKGECAGLWTQTGNDVVVDEEHPCQGHFEITVTGNQIKVKSQAGKVSTFWKK